MLWNKLIQNSARIARPRIVGRALRRFLLPSLEIHQNLFGKYKLKMDLSAGYLQTQLYLFPDSYELETQKTLRRLIEPGMTVFDIGANSGFLTVLMAELVGPEGVVHSFEPYQPNFSLLAQNIEMNRLTWVEAHAVALSDKQGSAVLSLNPINDGGHSLGDFTNNPDLEGWDREKLKVTVETTTLDRFVEANTVDRIDFIKIDVEGAEGLVFSGGREVLSGGDAPMIVCEVGDKAQNQFGKTEKDLRELLYSFGYRSYLMRDGLVEFGPETAVRGLENIFFQK